MVSPAAYSGDPASPPDSNTVTANITNDGSVSATAPIDWSKATTTEIDECTAVSDTFGGSLGTVCAGQTTSKSFTYSRMIGPYAACGEYDVPNTASFVTNDTGTTSSASADVLVNVPSAGGCSLTLGYWKTHSEFGPAPYDNTWAMLSNGASTPFYLSGQTWYQVFWTPPSGGNAYYILAHQYMAARLNQLNGATSTWQWTRRLWQATPSSTPTPLRAACRRQCATRHWQTLQLWIITILALPGQGTAQSRRRS